MRRLLAGGLGLSIGWFVAAAVAEEIHWRPSAPSPAVSLGRPVALDAPQSASDRQVVPVSYAAPVVVGTAPTGGSQSTTPVPANVLGQPFPNPPQGVTVYQGGPPPAPAFPAAPAPPPFAPPPGGPPPLGPPDAYNCGPVVGNPIPPTGACSTGQPLFGKSWLGTFNGFQSDHCFDYLASPITNPFLFEDPRALTEVRPIFMWQSTPNGNWLFRGGDAGYFGVQARVAVTDRLSFVIDKLGLTWLDERNGSGILSSSTGFSELWLGAKYTFLRNDDNRTVAAAGVTFQIPTGAGSVAQDTGTLSVVPYLSFAHNFGKIGSYGSINFMNTTGYAIGDNQRTDYFYSSFHVDFDVADAHRLYPMLEMNWFEYTGSGHDRNLGFEGRDLVNFGSQGVSGMGTLTIAPGVRYKINEHAQAGVAFEFPLVSPRDLVDFRVTLDFILRY